MIHVCVLVSETSTLWLDTGSSLGMRSGVLCRATQVTVACKQAKTGTERVKACLLLGKQILEPGALIFVDDVITTCCVFAKA